MGKIMEKKKICILGGTGYLGEALVKSLLETSHEVTVVHRTQSNIENLIHLSNDNLVLWNQDEEVLDFKGIDCIVNCVCAYETSHSTDMEILKANFIYPIEMLELAIKAEVPEFIGINTGLPKAFNTYSLSKHQFHEWGKYKSNSGKIQFTNVILENYYGKNEPQARFLPSVIEKMKNNQDVLLTEGKQRRDFVYIEDVVNVLRLIIDKNDKPAYYEVPLGTGAAPMVREVVQHIHKELNSESELHFGTVALRRNEPDCVADVSELEKIGYKIQYDWKRGFKELVT